MRTFVAAANSYDVNPPTTASVAADRRLSTQRQASGAWSGAGADPGACPGGGAKPSPRLSIANRTAFQSLLHQCRYATTRFMSRLMSRACRTSSQLTL